MKVLLTAALVQFLTLTTFAQTSISNTKWKGHLEEPQSLDIVLDFRNDSLIATSAAGMELGIMFFSQSKDTLKLRKLKDQGPCGYDVEGFYRIEWSGDGDKLVLHIIDDYCKARARSITSTVYHRVKN